MTTLLELRAQVAKFMTYYLWAHLLIVPLLGLLIGSPGVWIATGGTAVLAGVATAAHKLDATSDQTGFITAACLMLIVSLMVAMFAGHPWQIDMHMYFFAALAILVTYSSWKVIFVATGIVAVHHLLMNFIAPSYVFPEGADFFRVVLHAVVVVLEAVTLMWIAAKTTELFASSDQAKEEALAAVETANTLKAEAETKAAEAQALMSEREAAERRVEESQAAQEAERNDMAMRERERLEALAQEFETSVGQLVEQIASSSEALNSQATNITSISEQGNSAIGLVSNATHNASQNVQTVAASAEELSASIAEIAQQVSQSNEAATSAVETGKKTNQEIEQLSEQADGIGTVVAMISDIAEQTNLLALNATIEAARAGDAGKGFAVVASEVKSLANQSAGAADEIQQKITAMQRATEAAVSSIKEITSVIESLSHGSTAIAAAVEEQDSATREIARSAALASDDTQSATGSVAGVSESVSSTLDVSSGLLTASESLQTLAEELRASSSGFISNLRG